MDGRRGEGMVSYADEAGDCAAELGVWPGLDRSLRSDGSGRLAGVAHSADARTQLGAGAVSPATGVQSRLLWIFFRQHALAALVEVVLLWLAIGATTLAFGRVSPLAAFLMVPYLVWVAFATALNAAFWRLN